MAGSSNSNEEKMSALVNHAMRLVDRICDLKASLIQIERGKGGDPRIIARAAIVADKQARDAIAAELDAQTGKIDASEDEVA